MNLSALDRTARLLALVLGVGAAGAASARDVVIDLHTVPFGPALTRAYLACAPDAQRLCEGAPVGGGRIVACLAEQRDALSAPCAEEFLKAEILMDAMVACLPDAERFCSTVPMGGGRIVSCLASNQDRISDACFDGMAASVEAYGGVVE